MGSIIQASFEGDFALRHGSTQEVLVRGSRLSSRESRELMKSITSNLSQTPAAMNWWRIMFCPIGNLKNISLYGKIYESFNMNYIIWPIYYGSYYKHAFLLVRYESLVQINNFSKRPFISNSSKLPNIVSNTPRLSYIDAMNYCPNGLCKS